MIETPDAVEDGPVVLPLSVAVERHPELVEPHLGTIVAGDQDVFTASNDAEWSGGAFVYVPRGVRVDAPILLTAIADAAGTALHRRTLIVLDEGAEAEVWEQFLSGSEDGEAMLNTVVELVVGQNARLRYVCGQDINEKSWIFGTQRAEVARDGHLEQRAGRHRQRRQHDPRRVVGEPAAVAAHRQRERARGAAQRAGETGRLAERARRQQPGLAVAPGQRPRREGQASARDQQRAEPPLVRSHPGSVPEARRSRWRAAPRAPGRRSRARSRRSSRPSARG